MADMKQETRHRVPRISDRLMEQALRNRGWPYVAIDEAKRAIFCDVTVEPFDFIVYQQDGPCLLVDTGRRNHRSLAKLRVWGERFGPDFLPVFARTRQGGRIAFVAAENGRDVPTTLGLTWTAALSVKE